MYIAGKFFLTLCLAIAVTQLLAQDGPFSFNDKTTVFTGNALHWDATQDVNTNLIWSTWSDRFIKINGATFRQNGNVGLGGIHAYDKLHITDGSIRLQQTGNATGLFSDISFNTYRDTEPTQIGARIRFNTVANDNSGYPSAMKTGEIQFLTKWGWAEDYRMVIKADGRVGINTTNPATTLDVNGGVKIAVANNSDNASPGLVAVVGDDFSYDNEMLNHYGLGFHYYNDGNGNGLNAYLSSYNGLDFFSGGINRLRVNSNGTVGIGTADTKGYRLAVNGKTISEEVVVKLYANWPDYVFEPDYDLPSLNELEQYIKVNKHLPEVPSATEVKERGLSLGEMNVILLEKVEQLTLYVIALKKENEEIKKQLSIKN